MDKPTPADERVIADIDAATTEWDSVVQSWHVPEHVAAIDAVTAYEAWLNTEPTDIAL